MPRARTEAARQSCSTWPTLDDPIVAEIDYRAVTKDCRGVGPNDIQVSCRISDLLTPGTVDHHEGDRVDYGKAGGCRIAVLGNDDHLLARSEVRESVLDHTAKCDSEYRVGSGARRGGLGRSEPHHVRLWGTAGASGKSEEDAVGVLHARC